MKRYSLIIYNLLFFSLVFGQDRVTVKLNTEQIEALFLKQNLQLVAERMNIDLADAEIAQAKLWENPTFTLADLNLWSTATQRTGEEIPPLFGNFGRNTEFSVELSQLIYTANKRKKLIAREKVSKEIVIQEFEDVLRGLKTELRKTISELV